MRAYRKGEIKLHDWGTLLRNAAYITHQTTTVDITSHTYTQIPPRKESGVPLDDVVSYWCTFNQSKVSFKPDQSESATTISHKSETVLKTVLKNPTNQNLRAEFSSRENPSSFNAFKKRDQSDNYRRDFNQSETVFIQKPWPITTMWARFITSQKPA